MHLLLETVEETLRSCELFLSCAAVLVLGTVLRGPLWRGFGRSSCSCAYPSSSCSELCSIRLDFGNGPRLILLALSTHPLNCTKWFETVVYIKNSHSGLAQILADLIEKLNVVFGITKRVLLLFYTTHVNYIRHQIQYYISSSNESFLQAYRSLHFTRDA